jgi:hypothetical protein
MWLAVTDFHPRPISRQSEIQNLDAGFGDHDVARLEIAVNDALGVRLRQRGGNLRCIEECRLHGKGTAPSDFAAMVSPSTSSITR